MNTTRRHLTAVPALPGHPVETFVLDVHRAYKSWCYYPATVTGPARVEDAEVQAGTYPVRVETSPAGDLLAVVDLDVVITRRMTWRWWLFPRIERPYTRAVEDIAWAAWEVTDGAPIFDDEHTDPVATWRRVA